MYWTGGSARSGRCSAPPRGRQQWKESGVQSFWNKTIGPIVMSFGFQEIPITDFSNDAIDLNVRFFDPCEPWAGDAIQGGKEITLGFGTGPQVAAHEFGHTLGFPNSYIKLASGFGQDIPCFEEDLMATNSSGKDVRGYHATLLVAEY